MKINIATHIITAFVSICLTLAVAAAIIQANGYFKTDDYRVIHDLYASDESLDKSVTVKGYYSNSLIKEDGTLAEKTEDTKVYHFITAMDEPGCCTISIEFVSANEEYPGIGDFVEVSGVYSLYTEDSHSYSTIKDASWKHIAETK